MEARLFLRRSSIISEYVLKICYEGFTIFKKNKFEGLTSAGRRVIHDLKYTIQTKYN